jgi:hypothetical protein
LGSTFWSNGQNCPESHQGTTKGSIEGTIK